MALRLKYKNMNIHARCNNDQKYINNNNKNNKYNSNNNKYNNWYYY